MARPKPETPAQRPMACARSRGSGKADASTERLPGASAAAPTPCTTRPKRSQPSVGANPQNIEPSRNSTIPARKRRLRPKRSPSVPPVSKRAAKDRVKASAAHCKSDRFVWRWLWIVGRAVTIIVVSKSTIKFPRQVTLSVITLLVRSTSLIIPCNLSRVYSLYVHVFHKKTLRPAKNRLEMDYLTKALTAGSSVSSAYCSQRLLP